MSGWTEVALGEVAGFVRGVTFKPENVAPPDGNGIVACMRTKNVQRQLDRTDVWGIPRSFVRRSEQYLATGDTLVSSANSWNLVGKCCWVPSLPEPSTFGGFVTVLRADEDHVEPRYLYRWFSSKRVQTIVRTFGRKTTSISNLDLARCLKLRFPLPPLEEQRRISRALDLAEAARDQRNSALSCAAKLLTAVFDEAFGRHFQPPVTIGRDLVAHPAGWRWELLTDVAQLATGHTPDRSRSDYWHGDIPWVTLTDIRRLDGKVVTATSEMVTEAGIAASSAVKLPAGTVCFSRTASVGFVTVAGRQVATSQDFVNWICGPRLDPIYLAHALMRSRDRLRGLSTGSTHKTIYFPTVERFAVLVPPHDLQLRSPQGFIECARLSITTNDTGVSSTRCSTAWSNAPLHELSLSHDRGAHPVSAALELRLPQDHLAYPRPRIHEGRADRRCRSAHRLLLCSPRARARRRVALRRRPRPCSPVQGRPVVDALRAVVSDER